MMVKFRQVNISDSSDLFLLVKEFPTPTPVSDSLFSELFSQRISDPASYMVVAELDGALIGYLAGFFHAAFYAAGKVAWVDEVLVLDRYRRLGVGKCLMQEFEEWASMKNCVLVSLATAGAARFYEGMGYTSKAGYYKKYL